MDSSQTCALQTPAATQLTCPDISRQAPVYSTVGYSKHSMLYGSAGFEAEDVNTNIRKHRDTKKKNNLNIILMRYCTNSYFRTMLTEPVVNDLF